MEDIVISGGKKKGILGWTGKRLNMVDERENSGKCDTEVLSKIVR